jgi:hypothetical protein
MLFMKSNNKSVIIDILTRIVTIIIDIIIISGTIITIRGGKIWSDPRNPPDPSGPEPDPTWFFYKVKLTRT